MDLHIRTVVLDARDMKRAIAFWNAALHYESKYVSDTWTVLADPKKKGLDLGLQPNDEPKTDVNRAHMDLYTDDVEREIARLEKLGARRAKWEWYAPDATHVVMEDPEGNEFCLVPA